MGITITRNPHTDAPNDVMQPDFAEGWNQSRPARNTFYELLDGQQAVVLNTAGWRTGILRLVFASRQAALNAEIQHTRRGTFTYADDRLGALAGMVYAVAGDVQLYPSDTRASWRLDIPFREL